MSARVVFVELDGRLGKWALDGRVGFGGPLTGGVRFLFMLRRLWRLSPCAGDFGLKLKAWEGRRAIASRRGIGHCRRQSAHALRQWRRSGAMAPTSYSQDRGNGLQPRSSEFHEPPQSRARREGARSTCSVRGPLPAIALGQSIRRHQARSSAQATLDSPSIFRPTLGNGRPCLTREWVAQHLTDPRLGASHAGAFPATQDSNAQLCLGNTNALN